MMHRLPVVLRWLLAAACSVTAAAPVHGAQDPTFFPRNGTAAAHQRSLDIANPTVVMLVALQPGYEDLRLMAYLRAFQGVRTSVVFLTNGEGTPGDTLSQYPVWMTGERKGEAHRVARFLGSDAWFMNLPDLAAPAQRSELSTLWDTTGARHRLIEAIRHLQPDVIVVDPDRRGAGDRMTLRDSVAFTFVGQAIEFAATARDTSLSKGLLPWRVGRVLVRQPGSAPNTQYTKVHPLMHLSPIAMARQAAAIYRTLRLQISAWYEGASVYHPVTNGRIAGSSVSPDQIASAVTDPGPHLRSIGEAIRTTLQADRRGVKSASLKGVSALIDATEHLLVSQVKDLDRRERRIVIGWKEALEDLRCVVRNVRIEVSASESLLTSSQVFFLNIVPDPGTPKRGETVIIFPLAANGDWTVAGKSEYFFPLDSAVQFTLVTPRDLQYMIPYSDYGLTQTRLDFSFPYVVVHKDARRERNYMYHREIHLQFAPKRTFSLRTPLVFDSPSSPVIVELQNISRDKFIGDLVLSDTTGEPSRVDVNFSQKDEKALDTLLVPGDPALATGGRLLLLELSGRGGRRAVSTRAFRVAVDSSVHAALMSTVSGSAMEDALRVIGQPYAVVTPQDLEGRLAGIAVLLIDRAFLSDETCSNATREAISAWIRGGGHAIVFPQSGAGAEWLRSVCGATFTRIEPVPPAAPVTTPWTGALTAPGIIAAGDWDQWVETRAYDGISTARTDLRTTLAVRNGTVPLIAGVTVGNGLVTLVAADLASQIMNYHPGVHRLLANLIALKRQ